MIQLTNNLPAVTEWFNGKTTVPGQPGFYQRAWGDLTMQDEPDFWDGKYWYYNGDKSKPARNQDRNWRGLTEEVKS